MNEGWTFSLMVLAMVPATLCVYTGWRHLTSPGIQGFFSAPGRNAQPTWSAKQTIVSSGRIIDILADGWLPVAVLLSFLCPRWRTIGPAALDILNDKVVDYIAIKQVLIEDS